jgi:hypothetical protein
MAQKQIASGNVQPHWARRPMCQCRLTKNQFVQRTANLGMHCKIPLQIWTSCNAQDTLKLTQRYKLFVVTSWVALCAIPKRLLLVQVWQGADNALLHY